MWVARLAAIGGVCVFVAVAVSIVDSARDFHPGSIDLTALVCPDDDEAAACKELARRTSEVACEGVHDGPISTSTLTCDPRPLVYVVWRRADGGTSALIGRVSESSRDAGADWTCVAGARTLYVTPPSDDEPAARAAFDRVCAALREK